VGHEVVDNLIFSGRLIGSVEGVDLEPGDEELEPPSIPDLPNVARNVERQSLEKEDKTDPLVVSMVQLSVPSAQSLYSCRKSVNRGWELRPCHACSRNEWRVHGSGLTWIGVTFPSRSRKAFHLVIVTVVLV